MATKNTEMLHALTTAEIARQVRQFSERRQQIVDERAAIYANVAEGRGAQPPSVDEDEKAARQHAKSLLNGSAPASLSLLPNVSRDRQLYREQRGLDIVLKILSDQAQAASTAEAVAWAEEHRDAWCSLCREITLTAVRLGALEQRARELLATCIDVTAVRLPMGVVAGSRSAGEIPVDELAAAALAEEIVTEAEIRKAQKC